MSASSPAPDEAFQTRYERFQNVSRTLNQVSREIGPALHLDAVLEIVLNAMRSLVPFTGASISLAGDDGLRVVAADPPPTDAQHLRIPLGEGITGRVVATGESMVSADVRTDERLHHDGSDFGDAAVAALAVPLVCLGDVIGAIEVTADRAFTFADDDRLLLEALATQVAGAIESARRYEMVAELEVLKSDFIARVSHELRTPITIVAGFVATLLQHDDDLKPDERRQMLERIDSATARLSGLIDELLMLARLEAGVVAAQVEPVSLQAVLDDVRRQSRRPEDVTVEAPATAVQQQTDAALLARALGFLVDNALKYAGSCRLVLDDDGAIEVIDRGPGIPAAERSHVFERFTRSHVFERFTRSNQHTNVPGMGLGLPMARTLLSAAGADLVVEEPAAGVGTRMVVRFW